MSGHTFEPMDVYREHDGRLLVIMAGCTDRDGFVPMLDWEGEPNGIKPDDLSALKRVGGLRNLVTSHAGLVDALKELVPEASAMLTQVRARLGPEVGGNVEAKINHARTALAAAEEE